ncbi:NAD-dependent epimerase/dehydratase family protein [Paenibacillus terricola]|nr:NAD-dependent epimerase/dehydratase family protein [Paenibacillus terricola]
MMRVILGTGPLGKSVMRELLKRGEQVTMVNSSGQAAVPAGVIVKRADLMDRQQVINVLQGASVVYQCAAPPYHQWDRLEQMMDNITAGAIAANARLVFGDNLYMYGPVQGVIHEELPYAANTRKGLIRAEVARKLLALNRDGVLQTVIGRGSDFYGPEVLTSSAGAMFFKPIVGGKSTSVMGDPNCRHSYTFIDDFGRALVVLGEDEDAFGQAWHVPTAEATTMRQFAETAYRAAGFQPAKVRTMGRGMLRMAGLFMPAAKETIEMLYQFERDFVIDTRKFSERFGIEATPLEKGVASTVEWFRRRSS